MRQSWPLIGRNRELDRVRALVDELNVVEEIRTLRSEVDALSRRVAELEGSAKRKPPAKKRASPTKSGSARKKAS